MNKFNIVVVYIFVQQHHVSQAGVLVNVNIGPGKHDLKYLLSRGCSLGLGQVLRSSPSCLTVGMHINVFNSSNTDIRLEFLRTAFVTKFWKSPSKGQKSRIWEIVGQMSILRLKALNPALREKRCCCAIEGRRCFGRRILSDFMPFSCEVQESWTSTGRWPSFLQFSLGCVSQLLAALEKENRICGGWSSPPGKPATFLLKDCSCLNMKSSFLSVIDKMSVIWLFTSGKRNSVDANFAHLMIWDHFWKDHTFGEWNTISVKYGIHLTVHKWWRMVVLTTGSSSPGEILPEAAWACALRRRVPKHARIFTHVKTASHTGQHRLVKFTHELLFSSCWVGQSPSVGEYIHTHTYMYVCVL